jgi:hypothetical protein
MFANSASEARPTSVSAVVRAFESRKHVGGPRERHVPSPPPVLVLDLPTVLAALAGPRGTAPIAAPPRPDAAEMIGTAIPGPATTRV